METDMTNADANARHAEFPHLSLAAIAYSNGRNSVDYGFKCEFTDPALVAEFKAGRRSALAEDRLDADTEWDED